MYRQQQLIDLLANRRILVAGYGREGRSTHSLLQQLVPNSEVVIARNDEEIYAALNQAKAGNRPFDLIIKSPGIPTMKLEGLCSLDTITSQTDIFLQVYGSQTIAVTGTKGKSTTTSLIWHVLNQSMGKSHHIILAGNIGIPLFDILPQLDEQSITVAEFSCHQLENIHCGPHIGIILNLYQEHLDHYHSYQDYKMAKMQIVLNQQADDHCFYCTDSRDLNILTEELHPLIHSTLHPYSLQQALHSDIATMQTRLQGDHNLANIYVARQATALLGVSPTLFAQALASFEGLPHRLERVGIFNGITFYNDSISTIPEATMAAVTALREVDTLILGGFDRGIDYSSLGRFISQPPTPCQPINNLVFVGDAGCRMHQLWSGLGILDGKNCLIENDYSTLVSWCYRHTRQGGICLLSPAAASYDAFTNFEQRGNVYKQLIINLQ